MLTIDCKLFHSQKEQTLVNETVDREEKQRLRSASPQQAAVYRPTGQYNLFAGTQSKASTVFLFRESVSGAQIQDYFSTGSKKDKFHQTVDSYAHTFNVQKVYQPGSE